jgi:pullulanase
MLDDVFAGAAANRPHWASASTQRRADLPRVGADRQDGQPEPVPGRRRASTVTVAMTQDAASGVWSYTAPDASWVNRYYYTYTCRCCRAGPATRW